MVDEVKQVEQKVAAEAATEVGVAETEASTLWSKFVALVKSAPVVFAVGAAVGFVVKGFI